MSEDRPANTRLLANFTWGNSPTLEIVMKRSEHGVDEFVERRPGFVIH
jgi:hypothetical protein